jgi:hypothetical protein
MYVWVHAGDMDANSRETYLNLLLACGLLCGKSFTKEQLAVTLRRTIEALALVELYLPCFHLDSKLHGLAHMPKRIMGAGSLQAVAAWVYEGMWKRFMTLTGNLAHPEISMTHKIADLEMASHLHLRDPDLFSSSFRQPMVSAEPTKQFYFALELSRRCEEGQLLPTIPGQGMQLNAQLSGLQRQALHAGYMAVQEQYKLLWEDFTRSFFELWWVSRAERLANSKQGNHKQ